MKIHYIKLKNSVVIIIKKKYKITIIYMEWYHKIFIVLKITLIVFYILTKLHIISNEVEVEYLIEDSLKIMVCIFCLYLFWPFRSKYQIKKHDRYFGFSAGVFMLISLKIFNKNNYFFTLINMIKNKLN
tara:strand:- start:91 stop:477 length:387 start_codon:yes stop_codon:yes gene_type:complete